MKLLDKIKDLFMDEVDVDDEIEIEEEEHHREREKIVDKPKKEENVLPKVMRETIKKEEEPKEEKITLRRTPEEFMKELNFGEDDVVKQEKPVVKEVVKEEVKEKIDLPPKRFIEFSEEDLGVPTRNRKVSSMEIKLTNNEDNSFKEIPKKISELYPEKEEVKEKPKFKATPVISPVYGILDKNYTKEEVKERDDESSMKRPSKKVDFEMVRKKAFGNLADEIKDNLLCENCELYKEVKKISALKEDDLLYEMTVDEEEEKEVTISKAYENYQEFGVAYEPKRVRKTPVEEEVVPEMPEEPVVEEPEEETNSLDDKIDEIINNNSQKVEIDEAKIDEEEEIDVQEKPEVVYRDKVDEEEEELPEEAPMTRTKKKEEKVDEDFFELIDSMYKERTDD